MTVEPKLFHWTNFEKNNECDLAVSNVVNLRLARKRKLRQEKERVADTNRKKHSISTKLKKAARKELSKDLERLERHKRDTPD